MFSCSLPQRRAYGPVAVVALPVRLDVRKERLCVDLTFCGGYARRRGRIGEGWREEADSEQEH